MDDKLRPAEPPAQVTPMGIEVAPRRTGYSALDLILAGSAILISCVSLFIAVQQSRIMERTLAASSWPLVQVISGNSDDKGRPVISLAVENQGVGPAIVKRFAIVYEGKRYENPYEFMRDCCGYVVTRNNPTEKSPTLSQPVNGKVIRGGESIAFFNMELMPRYQDAWRKLDAARFKLKFDSCYCSVLGDCWQSDLTTLNQSKVRECPLPPAKPAANGSD